MFFTRLGRIVAVFALIMGIWNVAARPDLALTRIASGANL
jgi:hypothetical protein